MSLVQQLGYLAFEVSDLDAWESFMTKVLGMAMKAPAKLATDQNKAFSAVFLFVGMKLRGDGVVRERA